MIGYLNGLLKAKNDRQAIIEVNNVGYSVLAPRSLLAQKSLSSPIELYIHTHVREDIFELYGLADLESVNFFKQMISVSGVGPKTALNIFELAQLDEIKKAIALGDTSLLTKVSGIGKKTAELIVLKLRDSNQSSMTVAGDVEAIDALLGLGYGALDVRQVLAQIDTTLPVEEKIKAALKLLSK